MSLACSVDLLTHNLCCSLAHLSHNLLQLLSSLSFTPSHYHPYSHCHPMSMLPALPSPRQSLPTPQQARTPAMALSTQCLIIWTVGLMALLSATHAGHIFHHFTLLPNSAPAQALAGLSFIFVFPKLSLC